jgi:hypothetical protein
MPENQFRRSFLLFMSCETGSRIVAAGPAGNTGISSLVSKAAHYAGKAASVTTGATAGGVAGGGLGTLIVGPVGMVAGGIVGGVAGGYLGKKRYEKRQAAAWEKQWRQSAVGKKAIEQRDQTIRKLKLDYKEKADKFKAQQQKIKDDYEQAKAAWLADKLPEKDAKKKAVASSLVAGGTMMAVEYLAAGKVTGAGAAWSGLASLVTYPEQVERLKNQAWKKSTEGQKADARYLKRMDNLRSRWRRARGEYMAQKAATEAKYETARAKALDR